MRYARLMAGVPSRVCLFPVPCPPNSLFPGGHGSQRLREGGDGHHGNRPGEFWPCRGFIHPFIHSFGVAILVTVHWRPLRTHFIHSGNVKPSIRCLVHTALGVRSPVRTLGTAASVIVESVLSHGGAQYRLCSFVMRGSGAGGLLAHSRYGRTWRVEPIFHQSIHSCRNREHGESVDTVDRCVVKCTDRYMHCTRANVEPLSRLGPTT